MKPKFYYMLAGALFFLSGQLLILGVSKIATAVNANNCQMVVIPDVKISKYANDSYSGLIEVAKQLKCFNEIMREYYANH